MRRLQFIYKQYSRHVAAKHQPDAVRSQFWMNMCPVADRTRSQWTLITTTAFVPKDVAIKMNALLKKKP